LISPFLLPFSLAALAAGGEVTLVDGSRLSGAIEAVEEGSLSISLEADAGGQESAQDSAQESPARRGAVVPFYEVESVVFSSPAVGDAELAPAAGPLVLFHGRGALAARVARSSGQALVIEITGSGHPRGASAGEAAAASSPGAAPLTFEAPLALVSGFRLDKAHPRDDLFEADSKEPPPSTDTVYVRRGGNLLRVEGVFRGLDVESLHLEFGGSSRRLARERVFGVRFAPLASGKAESGYPALFELGPAGSFPAFLTGLRAPARAPGQGGSGGEGGGGREILFRFAGAPAGAFQALPEAAVSRVRFFSDRVLFLSAADPAAVEETPVLGARSAFPWQRDRATSGRPLELDGRRYRRGLGVHARSALEYDLGGAYRSFAAVIGLDAAAGAEAGVTFRVLADGKEILAKDLKKRDPALSVLVPVESVRRLRLEVDYGPDGLDLGDHAVWADARVIK
jgi:hypothetical protein